MGQQERGCSCTRQTPARECTYCSSTFCHLRHRWPPGGQKNKAQSCPGEQRDETQVRNKTSSATKLDPAELQFGLLWLEGIAFFRSWMVPRPNRPDQGLVSWKLGTQIRLWWVRWAQDRPRRYGATLHRWLKVRNWGCSLNMARLHWQHCSADHCSCSSHTTNCTGR